MQLEAELDMTEVEQMLTGLESSMPELVRKIQKSVGEAAFSRSQDLCPVAVEHGGTLKRSGYRRPQGQNFIIGYTAPYAAHVEFGTRPHVIVPIRKKFLHWTVGGKHRFAKKVQHPGTQPQSYLRAAWNQIKPRVPNIARGVIERHLEET